MANFKMKGHTVLTQTGTDAPILNENVNLASALASATFPSGFPIKVTHFQDTNTQVVYGSAGYNYYNDTYTTNANQNTKLLIQYGIFYEMNSAGDTLQMAVSLDETDIGVWQDTQQDREYNIWTTSQTITSNLMKNTNYTIRLYIKSISGTVVIPRTGASPNWTLTITEIAI